MGYLTKEEQEFVDKIHNEMKFYDKYKEFMGEVKGQYLKHGPEVAEMYIRSHSGRLLQIACDEMLWVLFNKL
jgi:hypothetical protein